MGRGSPRLCHGDHAKTTFSSRPTSSRYEAHSGRFPSPQAQSCQPWCRRDQTKPRCGGGGRHPLRPNDQSPDRGHVLWFQASFPSRSFSCSFSGPWMDRPLQGGRRQWPSSSWRANQIGPCGSVLGRDWRPPLIRDGWVAGNRRFKSSRNVKFGAGAGGSEGSGEGIMPPPRR